MILGLSCSFSVRVSLSYDMLRITNLLYIRGTVRNSFSVSPYRLLHNWIVNAQSISVVGFTMLWILYLPTIGTSGRSLHEEKIVQHVNRSSYSPFLVLTRYLTNIIMQTAMPLKKAICACAAGYGNKASWAANISQQTQIQYISKYTRYWILKQDTFMSMVIYRRFETIRT